MGGDSNRISTRKLELPRYFFGRFPDPLWYSSAISKVGLSGCSHPTQCPLVPEHSDLRYRYINPITNVAGIYADMLQTMLLLPVSLAFIANGARDYHNPYAADQQLHNRANSAPIDRFIFVHYLMSLTN